MTDQLETIVGTFEFSNLTEMIGFKWGLTLMVKDLVIFLGSPALYR